MKQIFWFLMFAILFSNSALSKNNGAKERFVSHVASTESYPAAVKIMRPLTNDIRNKFMLEFPVVEAFAHHVILKGKKWFRIRLGPPMSRKKSELLCEKVRAIGHDFCEPIDVYKLAKTKPGFHGELALKPLADGRNMKLLSPIKFVDSGGRTWEVPSGSVTDGASIPSPLWSVIGSPFTGKYLIAAVIHDFFCRTKHRSWMLTHDVFYEAMIKNGVGKKRALLMYAAVYRFGPRWVSGSSRCWAGCGDLVYLDSVEIEPEWNARTFEKLRREIDSNDDLDQEKLKRIMDAQTIAHGMFDEDTGAKMKGYIVSYDEELLPSGPKRTYYEGAAPTRWGEEGRNPFELNITPGAKIFSVSSSKRNGVKVYRGPGTKYRQVGTIPKAAKKISIIGFCPTIWCKVRHENIEGYVDTRNLVATDTP